jgi:hypothetical protein
VTDAIYIFDAGNLISVFQTLYFATSFGLLATILPEVIRDFALFHGLLALGCISLAIFRLRRDGLAVSGGSPRAARQDLLSRVRPPVSDNAILWKEIFCESRIRSQWYRLGAGAVILAATFIPIALIVDAHWPQLFTDQGWNDFSEAMSHWVRASNVAVGCLTLLAVAIRASTSVTSERDRQTWDSLLTTRLTAKSILRAKWWGSLYGIRWGMLRGGGQPRARRICLAKDSRFAAFRATF